MKIKCLLVLRPHLALAEAERIMKSPCHSVTPSVRQEIDLLITRTVYDLEPPNLVCRFIVVVLIVK